MRVSIKKCVIILVLISVSILAWSNFSSHNKKAFTKTCNQPEKFQDGLHIFTNRVHQVLESLNVTHFLCYGSLWGEIRFGKLLPWEDKATLCLLNEDLIGIDEVLFARKFHKNEIHISYNSLQGHYVATPKNGDKKLRVLLTLFEFHYVIKMFRRIGWIRRILPPDCEVMESLHCFPPELVIKPLPQKEFGKNLIPVPREGIELQKYHYKDNWWKEIPKKNC